MSDPNARRDDCEVPLDGIDWNEPGSWQAVSSVQIDRGVAILSHTIHQRRYADLMRGLRG